MQNITRALLYVMVLTVISFLFVASTPNQNERPPQPFFQDFFQGRVILDDSAPPAGTRLIACIGSCEVGFESEPYLLDADGSFDQLEVNPKSENLVGHTITFYLVNAFGKLKAIEERPYVGVFDFYVQNLTFKGPMPAPMPTPTPSPTLIPTPTASLPIAGDPVVARYPYVALVLGSICVALGLILVGVARWKAA